MQQRINSKSTPDKIEWLDIDRVDFRVKSPMEVFHNDLILQPTYNSERQPQKEHI